MTFHPNTFNFEIQITVVHYQTLTPKKKRTHSPNPPRQAGPGVHRLCCEKLKIQI